MILDWFKGKAREGAEAALSAIDASERAGEWVQRGGRSARAALAKAAVAEKYARDREADLRLIRLPGEGRHANTGFNICMALRYGKVEKAPWVLKTCDNILANGAADGAERFPDKTTEALRTARAWAADFAPIALRMARLDSLKPKPTFSKTDLSPTVRMTLAEAGIDANPESVRVCEIEWIETELAPNEDGTVEVERVGRLKWPAETRFGTSRFSGRSNRARHHQCEACGHAIRNPFNWIPLLLDDADGRPHALWTGRDCAQKIFGIKMSGEARLEGAPASDDKEGG